MNFKYENQGTNTYLTYEIGADDQLDTMSLGMLTNNDIPGLAKTTFTQMDMTKFVRYNVSAKISVSQLFSGFVNKRRLLSVFSGIVNAVMSAEEYMLDISSLLLDLDYIFADVSTCDTVMVCIPVMNSEHKNPELGMFFKNIIFNTQFDQNENCAYVAQLLNYLNSRPVLVPGEFKELLDSLAQSAGAPAPAQQPPMQQPPMQQPPVQQPPVQQPPMQQPPVQQSSVQQPPVQQPPMQQPPVQQSSVKLPPVQQPPVQQPSVKQPPVQQPPMQQPPMQQPPMQQPPMQKAPAKAPLFGMGAKAEVPQTGEKAEKPKAKMSLFGKKKETAPEAKPAAPAATPAGFAVPGQKPPMPAQQPPVQQAPGGFAIPGQKPPMPGQQAPAGFAVPGQQPPVQQPNPGFAVPGQQRPPMPPQSAQPMPPKPVAQPAAPQSAPQPAYQPQPSVNGGHISFGETSVLGGGSMIGETSVLGVASVAEPNRINPHLIRIKNNENIPLNKPVYRIGKERSYVDYFIGDNTAISRSHANIVNHNGEFFIVDTNSTNHTYVEGRMIPSNEETKLEDGTKFRLANEDFEFKLY